jgi:hypothetical protein
MATSMIDRSGLWRWSIGGGGLFFMQLITCGGKCAGHLMFDMCEAENLGSILQ